VLVELFQALLLHLQIRDHVSVSRNGRSVAEPQGHDLQRHAGLQQMHSGSMPERVGRDVPLLKRRALTRSPLDNLR